MKKPNKSVLQSEKRLFHLIFHHIRPRPAGSRRRPQAGMRGIFSLNKRAFINTFVLIAAFASTALSDVAPDSAAHLELLVRQWSDLRLEIAREQQRWAEEKTAILNEIELTQNENEYLKRLIEEANSSETALAEKKAPLRQRRQKKQTVLDETSALLGQAEEQLSKWQSRIPASLRNDLDPFFRQVSISAADRERRPVTERVQTVMALYARIEALQGETHLVTEILDTPTGRQEMRVLYLGLAQSFAVSRDLKQAYIGRPGSDGWIWAPSPEAASQTAAAIAIYERRRIPELVTLPLKITEIPDGHEN